MRLRPAQAGDQTHGAGTGPDEILAGARAAPAWTTRPAADLAATNGPSGRDQWSFRPWTAGDTVTS